MKSYEERLPLIDEAIDKLGGEWPHWELNYLLEVTSKNAWACGVMQDEYLCTRQEFEQRVKEREAMEKYEYMKEYECNGVKPKLPDDVFVELKNKHTERWNLGTPLKVSRVLWSNIKEFRIVDERYKPETKNDWHEKGELPPVDETVITTMGEGKVVACSIDGSVCVLVNNHLHVYHRKALKPVPPEREQLISALTELNHYDGMVISKKTASAIVDAGWRPPKQD